MQSLKYAAKKSYYDEIGNIYYTIDKILLLKQ